MKRITNSSLRKWQECYVPSITNVVVVTFLLSLFSFYYYYSYLQIFCFLQFTAATTKEAEEWVQQVKFIIQGKSANETIFFVFNSI